MQVYVFIYYVMCLMQHSQNNRESKYLWFYICLANINTNQLTTYILLFRNEKLQESLLALSSRPTEALLFSALTPNSLYVSTKKAVLLLFSLLQQYCTFKCFCLARLVQHLIFPPLKSMRNLMEEKTRVSPTFFHDMTTTP